MTQVWPVPFSTSIRIGRSRAIEGSKTLAEISRSHSTRVRVKEEPRQRIAYTTEKPGIEPRADGGGTSSQRMAQSITIATFPSRRRCRRSSPRRYGATLR